MKPKIKLSAEVIELRGEVARLMNRAQRAEKDAERRLEHIRSFKEERLVLERDNAELRGYLDRVLEDDHIREIGVTPTETITHGEIEEARNTLRNFERVKSGAYQPLRTGPKSVAVRSYSGIDYPDANFGGYRNEKPKPLSWQDRE